MRKGLICSLFVLMLLLSACGGQKTQRGEAAQSVETAEEAASVMASQEEGSEADGDSSLEAQTVKPETNPDLKVVTSFVYGNDVYVVVENTGEQAILNFNVAYVNFDKNGFVTDLDGYEKGRFDAANLMPGDKTIGGWYGATGDYAVATITNVEYADGTTWEMNNIQLWAKDIQKSFTVDEQKDSVEKLKPKASMAEMNEYLELTDIYLDHGNMFSTDYDLCFSLKNISDQGIAKASLFVLEFDENGFPVSVSPYDTYCINGHSTGGTINLAAGQSGSYTDDLFASGNTTQIKAVLSYIEFQDGTEWDNPYLYEWIVTNNKTY